jgi:SAM-dependent methyltransferase
MVIKEPARKSSLVQDSPMYDSRVAQRTLDPKYMTSYLKQAQWAEFTKLKEIIGEVYDAFERRLTFFDIGIGCARIPIWLSCVDTWNKVAKYVGIDVSGFCLTQSKRIASAKRIANKVEVHKFDAVKLGSRSTEVFNEASYDIVICTYFTGGDFRPKEIELQTKENGLIVDYDINALRPNKNFIAVFKGAYDLLREKGKIVIGSLYCDNKETRKRQEDFYKRCEMAVITSSKDSFAATKEGFWSERFDQNRIYSYLSWVPRDKIELIPLDDYNFAFMVVISK